MVYGCQRLDLVGNNLTVVNWTNIDAVVLASHYVSVVSEVQSVLHASWLNGFLLPAHGAGQWARHVCRENNKRADALATKAMAVGEERLWTASGMLESFKEAELVRIPLDGGYKDGKVGFGWLLKVNASRDCVSLESWLNAP